MPAFPAIRRLIAGIAMHPAVLRWGAPLRALRDACGWRPPPIPLSQARNILVIRPDEIGDVVLTTPFLRELRRAAPHARITLLVKPACCDLVERCPHVDAVHALEFGSCGRLLGCVLGLRRRSLPWRGFDLVLLPRYDEDWSNGEAVAHLLAGRGVVATCRTPEAANRPPPPSSWQVYVNPAIGHEAMHPLTFLRWLGAGDAHNADLELWLTDEDRAFAEAALPACGRYVAIVAGARHAHRRWPVDRFAAIVGWLYERYGLIPVLLGLPDDPRPCCAAALDLAGRTSLRQAAAALARCALFVGNDGGLMHLAAATRIPVVEISGFRQGGDTRDINSPTRFGPWATPCRVVQPPPGAGALAIHEVDVDAVRAACAALLGTSKAVTASNAAAE